MDNSKKPETAEEMLDRWHGYQRDFGGGLEDEWRKYHERDKIREQEKDRERGCD